ncbi:MAG: hypothetical protein ACE5SW_13180 [Nitrososphaeraceae archaeon]
MNNSVIAVSCCTSSTIKTVLGALPAKLSALVDQLKSEVVDFTILSGLSEYKIVLSETPFNSK